MCDENMKLQSELDKFSENFYCHLRLYDFVIVIDAEEVSKCSFL